MRSFKCFVDCKSLFPNNIKERIHTSPIILFNLFNLFFILFHSI